jgi:DNA-3-methyladenine glycosylase
MAKKLPLKFYRRDTKKVARDLLGKRLVRVYKGQRLSGIIVETEAYLGIKDPAAHTFGGRKTLRNEVMWGDGGHAYIYFIYGMHFCLNAVTRESGYPEAVLIRAIQCTEGLKQIKKFRKIELEKNLGNGPGKLCQALQINRELNGVPLDGSKLFIEETTLKVSPTHILATSRIGVDYAGKAKLWPLRFYLKNNIYVSIQA